MNLLPELINTSLFGQQLTIKAYGFFMILAVVAVLLLSLFFIKKLKLPMGRSLLCLGVMAVAVPIGARGLHILINPSYYAMYPDRAAALNMAGFSLIGGLLLAALVGVVTAGALKIPSLRLADAVAPGLGIGLALMRIGCFLNGCCFGLPSHLPWAVRFPYGSPAHKYYMLLNKQTGSGFSLGQLFGSPSLHPTQLYEMLAALLAAGLAIYLIKNGTRSGIPFLSAALLFTIARLGNYFLRARPITNDVPAWFFPIMYLTLIVFLTAGLIFTMRKDMVDGAE
jgi:phosphatidylglycerol---prolipoprotein diacylglyceryl transferase